MYIVTIGTEDGMEHATLDTQEWRNSTSIAGYQYNGVAIAWVNLYKDMETSSPSMAASWMRGLLVINDISTLNGIDPNPSE